MSEPTLESLAKLLLEMRVDIGQIISQYTDKGTNNSQSKKSGFLG